MKRVGLFLGVEPFAGGMFQYAQSVTDALESLDKDKFQVEIAYVNAVWAPFLAGRSFSVTKLDYGLFGQRIAKALLYLRVPGRMSRLLSVFCNPIYHQLKRLHCDLWIFPAQDAIAYQLNLPVMAIIHDLMHRYERQFPEVGGGYRYYIREHRFRNTVHWAKSILVDSQIGKDQVVESYNVNSEKIFVLPYIPVNHLNSEKTAIDVIKKYGLPEKFIFYPAQFWAHKNHILLLSAAASLRRKHPDLHLVFTGDRSNNYKDIHRFADSLGMLGNVSFVGYIPDAELAQFYRQAQAMIMPTYLGPTNIPPLEAIACDCPVAVSRIYAMPEQLGDAALYFDQRLESEIEDALDLLWNDEELLAMLRKEGRKKMNGWNRSFFDSGLSEALSNTL